MLILMFLLLVLRKISTMFIIFIGKAYKLINGYLFMEIEPTELK